MENEIHSPAKFRFKPRLLCKSKVKQFALDFARANPAPTRAKMFTRVGEDFYVACETNLKAFIQSRIRSQPSKGKTLT